LGLADVHIGEKRLGLVDILVFSHQVAVHRLILRPAVKLAIAAGTHSHCWFVTGFEWLRLLLLLSQLARDDNVITGERRLGFCC
jgi:hypothetical protein